MKKSVKMLILSIGIIFILMFSLFLIRIFSEKQIDDVSPGIECDEELLKKADVFYVIPYFENKSIENEKEWCGEILTMNKKIQMHGVNHDYREFYEDKSEEYIDEGINMFNKCFGFNPEKFKPPQLAISKNNKDLVKRKMILDLKLNQILHKVYHCNDSGKIPNNIIDLI